MSNSVRRAATKAAKTIKGKGKVETRELEGAYIIPAESGDKIIQALAELPIKHSQLVGPIIDLMQKAVRGNITVTIDPSKQASKPPVPAPAKEAEMKVEKPE